MISLQADEPLLAALPKSFRPARQLEAKIRRIAKAVGRLNIVGGPWPYLGTVVAVGPRSVIAARHAAEQFFERSGANGTRIGVNQQLRPSVSFTADGTGEHLEIEDVTFVHPVLDVAVLRTNRDVPGAATTLAAHRPRVVAGRFVAAFGYPEIDQRNDPAVMGQVLRGKPGTLHVSVGRLKGVESATARGHNVKFTQILHDCSTLGGCSGGPLLDVASGHVIGIHIGGTFLRHNIATPSWEIGRDPRVRIHPVAFSKPASPWDDLWEPLSLAPTKPPPRNGMLTDGPKIQLWENDNLIWEEEVAPEPVKAVVNLILDLFQNRADAIWHFAGDLPGKVQAKVPKDKGAEEAADELIAALKRLGAVDDKFFQALKVKFKMSHQLIHATQYRWKLEGTAWRGPGVTAE